MSFCTFTQMSSIGILINPFIYPLSIFCVGSWCVISSHQWVRGNVCPGQVISPSQGHMTNRTDNISCFHSLVTIFARNSENMPEHIRRLSCSVSSIFPQTYTTFQIFVSDSEARLKTVWHVLKCLAQCYRDNAIRISTENVEVMLRLACLCDCRTSPQICISTVSCHTSICSSLSFFVPGSEFPLCSDQDSLQHLSHC